MLALHQSSRAIPYWLEYLELEESDDNDSDGDEGNTTDNIMESVFGDCF